MVRSDLNKIFRQFESALKRLNEALNMNISENEIALDGSIQRFEFCFEICWKTVKRALKVEGIDVNTPREVFKEVFKLGWLKDGDDFWQKMIIDRNETSHTYDQKKAMEIYSHLKDYATAYQRLLNFLMKKYPE